MSNGKAQPSSNQSAIKTMFDINMKLSDTVNFDNINTTYAGVFEKQKKAINLPVKFNSNNNMELESPIARFHLIYAYLIENTRIVEIFRRVLHESRHGERLGKSTPESEWWLFVTEQLFFRDPFPFLPFSIFSFVRPDSGASRRNAYFRMFGMDLNHGLDDGKPYPYQKPEAANREFVATFESFLTEVWIGIANASNSSGTKPTDDGAIQVLAQRLQEMLTTRRLYGSFLHVEFYSYCMMLWFHNAVFPNDSAIVQSLKADGTGPDERLKKIAERVKLPANRQAFYFFNLAYPLSNLLVLIEDGIFDGPTSNVQPLYDHNKSFKNYDPFNTEKYLDDDMKAIITNWSNATGRNLKERTKDVSVVR